MQAKLRWILYVFPGACRAAVSLKPVWKTPCWGQCLRGGEAAIGIVDAKGKAITLPFSLKGFEDARDKLVKQTTSLQSAAR